MALRAWILAGLALTRIAHAQPVTTEPSVLESDSVTLQRFDGSSRIGLDATGINTVIGKLNVWKLDLHAQYVDPLSHLGAYVQAPLVHDNGRPSYGVPSATVYGHLELGALWSIAPTPWLGVVVHAGVATAAGHGEHEPAYIANAALLRPHDLYGSIPGRTALRAGASLLVRRDLFFARLDTGADKTTPGEYQQEGVPAVHVNAAVGIRTNGLRSFAMAVEMSTLKIFEQPTNPLSLSYSDEASPITTLAGSFRYRWGSNSAYAAIVVPRSYAQRYMGQAITFGAEYTLPTL